MISQSLATIRASLSQVCQLLPLNMLCWNKNVDLSEFVRIHISGSLLLLNFLCWISHSNQKCGRPTFVNHTIRCSCFRTFFIGTMHKCDQFQNDPLHDAAKIQWNSYSYLVRRTTRSTSSFQVQLGLLLL